MFRCLHLTTSQAGLVSGFIGVVGGFAGTIIGGVIAEKISTKTRLPLTATCGVSITFCGICFIGVISMLALQSRGAIPLMFITMMAMWMYNGMHMQFFTRKQCLLLLFFVLFSFVFLWHTFPSCAFKVEGKSLCVFTTNRSNYDHHRELCRRTHPFACCRHFDVCDSLLRRRCSAVDRRIHFR